MCHWLFCLVTYTKANAHIHKLAPNGFCESVSDLTVILLQTAKLPRFGIAWISSRNFLGDSIVMQMFIVKLIYVFFRAKILGGKSSSGGDIPGASPHCARKPVVKASKELG